MCSEVVQQTEVTRKPYSSLEQRLTHLVLGSVDSTARRQKFSGDGGGGGGGTNSESDESDGSCWMPSDRRRICSAVNYSTSSISTSLSEVWKAISVTIVSLSSCIASPKLSVTAGLLSDTLSRAKGQSFFFLSSDSVPEICSSLLPFNWCPWEPVSLLCPDFEWSLGPREDRPSHLPFTQTQPATQRAAAAPSSLSLTALKLNDRECCFQLFIQLTL